MLDREIINEYRKLNSEEQKVLRRWLWGNAIVGATLLAALCTRHQGPGRQIRGNCCERYNAYASQAPPRARLYVTQPLGLCLSVLAGTRFF